MAPAKPDAPDGAGLCARCRLARVTRNAHGSAFILCRLSETDVAFAKYPKLPVLRCDGFLASRESGRSEQEKSGSGTSQE